MSAKTKILQASAWYPPHHMGGTETYLEGLVSDLLARNIECRVVTPRVTDVSYDHQGAEVLTYPVNDAPTPAELRGDDPHDGFGEFQKILAAHRAAIYHQHSWARGCGPHHLRAAKEAGLPTILTVHVPGNICLRGTMTLFGQGPCDGLVEEKRCGACWLEGRGANRNVATMISATPLGVAKAMRTAPRLSGVSTALSARALGAVQKQTLAEMIKNADRIVAVCQWLFDALALNGVPREKLLLSRQGVDVGLGAKLAQARCHKTSDPADPLRLLYLGRWHPVKGVDVAARAIASLAHDVPVTLTIHGIEGGAEEVAVAHEVRAIAQSDPRILIKPPVPREDFATCLAQFDALVVPSTWLETGPLVVLEALAAGLFVLGSNRGGIAELITKQADGLLIEPGNVSAWSAAIKRVCDMRAKGELTGSPKPCRTMADAAKDVATLYGELV